jgi:hypothetical protein
LEGKSAEKGTQILFLFLSNGYFRDISTFVSALRKKSLKVGTNKYVCKSVGGQLISGFMCGIE